MQLSSGECFINYPLAEYFIINSRQVNSKHYATYIVQFIYICQFFILTNCAFWFILYSKCLKLYILYNLLICDDFNYVKIILIYFNSLWCSTGRQLVAPEVSGGLWMPARRKSGQYIGRGTLIDAILYYRFSATVHAVKPATHTHTYGHKHGPSTGHR